MTAFRNFAKAPKIFLVFDREKKHMWRRGDPERYCGRNDSAEG